MSNMNEIERVKKVVKDFEDICLDLATHRRTVDYSEFEAARNNLINEPSLRAVLPDWILKNRYGSQFWQFVKSLSPDYAGRREFIWSSVAEIYGFIENGTNRPVSLSVKEINDVLKNQNIDILWKKIHSRRDDPEGAITASRTMLESTLKHILDELKETYSDKEDLPDLYKKVSQKLNLSPGNHSEQTFKQILQGIASVVVGFSSLRNKYGDAHGKGTAYVGPEKRHADLVVNLSGSACVFLVETLEAHLKK